MGSQAPVSWRALCLGLIDGVEIVGRHNVLAGSKAALQLVLLLLDVLLLLLDPQKLPVPHQLAARRNEMSSDTSLLNIIRQMSRLKV